jgi:hypothetical protein
LRSRRRLRSSGLLRLAPRVVRELLAAQTGLLRSPGLLRLAAVEHVVRELLASQTGSVVLMPDDDLRCVVIRCGGARSADTEPQHDAHDNCEPSDNPCCHFDFLSSAESEWIPAR